MINIYMVLIHDMMLVPHNLIYHLYDYGYGDDDVQSRSLQHYGEWYAHIFDRPT